MEDIIKIDKSPEESGLLITRISETTKNEGFISMLLGTLVASILGNSLTEKRSNKSR